MIRKGQSDFKFIRPMSNMRVVLLAVEQGNCTRRAIIEATGLIDGKVKSALFNLSFIGAVKKSRSREGTTIWITPGSWEAEPVAKCLKGVRSIFDVR